MEEGKILLLLQLIKGLENNFRLLEKGYENSQKEAFEKGKDALVDIHNKMNSILSKEKNVISAH
jgi:hypothetical protein